MQPRPYFASTSWEDVERINFALCQSAKFEPGRSDDGYEPARALWADKHNRPLSFLQAADLSRECHRLAPFRFLNGNTFASCARVALAPALDGLDQGDLTFARAALAHYIAGTIERDELRVMIPGGLGD
jgi:hypothetical protein